MEDKKYCGMCYWCDGLRLDTDECCDNTNVPYEVFEEIWKGEYEEQNLGCQYFKARGEGFKFS